jgi:hypothetical protein
MCQRLGARIRFLVHLAAPQDSFETPPWGKGCFYFRRAGTMNTFDGTEKSISTFFDGQSRSANRCLHRKGSAVCTTDFAPCPQAGSSGMSGSAGNNEMEHAAFRLSRIMLGMAAFKEHCSIGFWKGELILGKRAGSGNGMGHFGKITSRKDLPSDKRVIEYVRKAAVLNKQGIKKPANFKPRSARPELTVPEYLRAALRKNKKAAATFEGFSYTNKKEYVSWLTEAKREETRSQRLQTTIAWLAEGKVRNWKYLSGPATS